MQLLDDSTAVGKAQGDAILRIDIFFNASGQYACNQARFPMQLVPEGMQALCRSPTQILGCDPESECFVGDVSDRPEQTGRY